MGLIGVNLYKSLVICFGYLLFGNCKIIFTFTHIICIRVASTAEEVVFKVVAEPYVPSEQAQQEVRESPVQGLVEPSVE